MFSFKSIGLNSSENSVVLFVTFLFICIVTYIISNKIIIKLISNLFKKTSTKIDDILIEKGFLKRLSNLIPLIVFYNLFNQFYGDYLIINRLTLALIAIVVTLVGALRAFDLIAVMTAGGPWGSSEVLAYKMYQEALFNYRMGYGAAIATILFLIMDIYIAWFLYRLFKNESSEK